MKESRLLGAVHIDQGRQMQSALNQFDDVMKKIQDTSSSGRKILFVCTMKPYIDSVVFHAERCCMPYYAYSKWTGGLITNFKTIRNSVNRLVEMRNYRASLDFKLLPKRARVEMERKICRLSRYEGLINMDGLPSMVVAIDVMHDTIMLREAKKKNIPVVSLIKRYNSPGKVDYLISGKKLLHGDVYDCISKIADSVIDCGAIVRGRTISLKPNETIKNLMESTVSGDEIELTPSNQKSDKRDTWNNLYRSYKNNEVVTGQITQRVKGGLSVDVGVKAFLPRSQVDLSLVNNLEMLLGEEMDFRIIKFNRRRGKIILSRRILFEEERQVKRIEEFSKLEEAAEAEAGSLQELEIEVKPDVAYEQFDVFELDDI